MSKAANTPVSAQVECRVRRSSRAKRLRLVVRPGLIELVAPVGMSETKAMNFLAQHRDWAESKAREFQHKMAARVPVGGFCDFLTVPWEGQEVPLRIHEEDRRRVSVKLDEVLHITLPRDLGDNRDRAAKRALYLWASRRLMQRLKEMADHHAAQYGVAVRQIRIKSMKTRWGSCGPRNDININWLLALVPEVVLDYVVVHEICHILERNHSPAFWALVARHCPDYLRHRQWLRAHGPGLMQRFSVDS